MVTTREVLVAARAIIADPARWTTKHLASNEEGECRYPDDPDACRFCGIGAAAKAALDLGLNSVRVVGEIQSRLDVAAKIAFPDLDFPREGLRPTALLNDSFGDEGHERVLKAYDVAIERETI